MIASVLNIEGCPNPVFTISRVRRLIVELHPERLEQFPGIFSGQGSFAQLSLEKGKQVLVQPAGVEGIPGIQFGNDP